MSQRQFLVTGATGNVGGAVTDALLEMGHAVRALVRDEAAPNARDLAARGVELRGGDLGEPESIVRAAQGVDGLFAVTTPVAGADVEVTHGKHLVQAAESAGVSHLVFSSVASARQRTGIAHFDSKAQIEARIESARVPWTITAPVFFYENLLFPWNAADIEQGRFRQALPPDVPLQQISFVDVGLFNALVLERGTSLAGERIEIASDEVTGARAAAVLSDALGRSIEYEEQSLDEVRDQFADMAVMYEWFRHSGFEVDIPRLKSRFPTVPWRSFENWAAAQYAGAGARS